MTIERTLSIVKPDAVAKNVIGQIYTRFESAGLRVIAAKMKHLSRTEAEGFYAVHKDRPIFAGLVEIMTSGPVMIQVLEGEGADVNNRVVRMKFSVGVFIRLGNSFYLFNYVKTLNKVNIDFARITDKA